MSICNSYNLSCCLYGAVWTGAFFYICNKRPLLLLKLWPFWPITFRPISFLGRESGGQWVTSYKLLVSSNAVTWSTLRNSEGAEKVFQVFYIYSLRSFIKYLYIRLPLYWMCWKLNSDQKGVFTYMYVAKIGVIFTRAFFYLNHLVNNAGQGAEKVFHVCKYVIHWILAFQRGYRLNSGQNGVFFTYVAKIWAVLTRAFINLNFLVDVARQRWRQEGVLGMWMCYKLNYYMSAWLCW